MNRLNCSSRCHARFGFAAASLLTIVAAVSSNRATADTPVFKCRPDTFVSHAIQIQVLGQSQITIGLRGPTAVAPLGAQSITDGVHEWFKISKAPSQTPRTVRVTVDGQPATITLGELKYVLAPAQVVYSGRPKPFPQGTGYQAVFAIDQASETVLAGVPRSDVLVALPCGYAHHDDVEPIADASSALLIRMRATDTQPKTSPIKTIDLFGLNKLDVTSPIGSLRRVELADQSK